MGPGLKDDVAVIGKHATALAALVRDAAYGHVYCDCGVTELLPDIGGLFAESAAAKVITFVDSISKAAPELFCALFVKDSILDVLKVLVTAGIIVLEVGAFELRKLELFLTPTHAKSLSHRL